MSNPSVLLAAYQCAPGQGSASQIGWDWYVRLCGRTQVTLVTHSRNRPHLEAAGAPLPGSEVIFIDTEWFAGPLYRWACRLFPRSEHAVFLISSLDFYLYDWLAVRTLRKRTPAWDVIHAVTPVSPWAATRLHKLGAPLLLGPWNGGLASPTTFREILRDDAGWIYGLRGLGRWADRLAGSTRRAALILSANAATDRVLPRHALIERMPENSVDVCLLKANENLPRPSRDCALQVLFVGRLIPVKGVAMLLEAVERVCRKIPIQLTVVGDGPLRLTLEEQVRTRGLQESVTFTGMQTPASVARYMASAHLLCLPSVRESGGAVLLEAMACALPVVAVNYGGPQGIINDEVGRLLSATGPEACISEMSDAFRDAFARPDEWRERGWNGRRRAEQMYDWRPRVERLLTIYRRILEEEELSCLQPAARTTPLP